MEDTIVIQNVRPYDGTYKIDLTDLEQRHWGWVKKYAGYLPWQIENDSFSDPQLVAVWAMAALHKAGKIEPVDAAMVFERFESSTIGSVQLQISDRPAAEDDAVPPETSSPSNNATSGDDSRTSSDPSTPTPSDSGTPDSATSESVPETLEV